MNRSQAFARRVRECADKKHAEGLNFSAQAAEGKFDHRLILRGRELRKLMPKTFAALCRYYDIKGFEQVAPSAVDRCEETKGWGKWCVPVAQVKEIKEEEAKPKKKSSTKAPKAVVTKNIPIDVLTDIVWVLKDDSLTKRIIRMAEYVEDGGLTVSQLLRAARQGH